MQEKPVRVVVDFAGVRLVTGSFLDEMVLRIAKQPCEGVEIVFRLSDIADLAKLEKVCAIRRVKCMYQVGDGPIERTKLTSQPKQQSSYYPGHAFFAS